MLNLLKEGGNFFVVVVLGGGTLLCLQCIKYVLLEFIPSTALLHPLKGDIYVKKFAISLKLKSIMCL
jgi:hypothetical protein